jgi:hypothetical protein
MDASSKGPEETTSFDYTVKVEASRARFELLETMEFLDVDHLSQADEARIAIGTVESDCGRRLVYAIVEKGMVTAIEVDQEGTATQDEMDPATIELVKAASAALSLEPPARKLPIPVADLIGNPRIIIDWWTCAHICIFGFCFFCCWGENPIRPWGFCELSDRSPGVRRTGAVE